MHRIPTNVLSRGMFTDERAGGISRIIFKNSRLRSNIISQQTQVTQHLQIMKKCGKRSQAMFALSHCRYGIVNQRFKKNAGTGRVSAMGPAHLKRQQLFVSNVWWWCQSIRTIQGWLQSLLETFWMPWMKVEYKRKIRISDDHWRSDWTNNELTSKYLINWQQIYFLQER